MDHRGDGYFQLLNMNRAKGVNLLDTNGSRVVLNPQRTDVSANAGTDPAQEWDILPAGNCGDIPAKCANPPLVSNGKGDFYMIVNKATGNVLATSGTNVEQQAPAAPSNGDWLEPANKGQLWRITPAHITAGK
jgi:hypothetical protein